ncbi:YlxQ family RNA-binding protein [Bacillus marinisedimentorum]|uniref:YlxQ family RNA-binding protein n=1 Tax=Bacillus marinisedimentorum TaxID=1821260 RepID=UPI0007E0D7E9|nr:YlxQ family RNA-binding protein [Bacillus marinisedimentorum]
MRQSKGLSLLGLANRARKCISGEELVLKEIRNGNARLVILAGDASENTVKKMTDKCKTFDVPLRFAQDRYTLGEAIGKPARVSVAVTDEGFAKKLISLLD